MSNPVLTEEKGVLSAYLQGLEIDMEFHFVPIHRYNLFENARCGDLSVTEKVVGETLTIPLHSQLPPESVERVIEGTTGFFV